MPIHESYLSFTDYLNLPNQVKVELELSEDEDKGIRQEAQEFCLPEIWRMCNENSHI